MNMVILTIAVMQSFQHSSSVLPILNYCLFRYEIIITTLQCSFICKVGVSPKCCKALPSTKKSKTQYITSSCQPSYSILWDYILTISLLACLEWSNDLSFLVIMSLSFSSDHTNMVLIFLSSWYSFINLVLISTCLVPEVLVILLGMKNSRILSTCTVTGSLALMLILLQMLSTSSMSFTASDSKTHSALVLDKVVLCWALLRQHDGTPCR